ncbi:MAG TPA: hypothetical protein VFE17_03635 [Candidatus Baltobacteraceae bacterium]|jgi:hypothetical protein|nr:hypothetical protein [Candidatus Baltobacteraceae bacterium]
MWFQDYKLADYPVLRYASGLFGDGLIANLSAQEADAVLAELDRLWLHHHREIVGAGLPWWRRALLPGVAPTAASALQTHENRLRALEWATNSYTSSELLLYRVEGIVADPARDFDLVAALKFADPSAMKSPHAYERQLMRLTRAQCRELLRSVESIMSTRHWSHNQFFKHYLGDVPGFDPHSFMSRLRNHSGEHEPPLVAAASRSAEVERRYDNMDPQAAWIELCHKTGRLDLIASRYSIPVNLPVRAISTLLYEAQTLLPDEDVAGLIRASHLAIYAGAVPGLTSLLRMEYIQSKMDVARALSNLTPYEAFVIDRYLEEKNPSPAELAMAVDLWGWYDSADRRPRAEELLSYFRKKLDQRAHDYGGFGSLKQTAAQAVTRADAWRALVNEVEGSAGRFNTWTPEARRDLALELMHRYPEGLPEYLEMLAVKALLGPELRDPELLRRAACFASDMVREPRQRVWQRDVEVDIG